MKRFHRLLTICILLSAGVVLAEDAARAQSGSEILDAAGTTGGLVVHVGCGDGSLTAELGSDDQYLVHGLDADTANVETARRRIQELGLYGRVSVQQFTGPSLPYADNLVNLLVVEESGSVSEDEVLRVLTPGGVALVGRSRGEESGFANELVKPWPEGVDEWTHFRHSAAGNMVSGDELVGPPKHLQWVSGPIFQRHHGMEPSITATVTSGGRIFYIIDESPTSFGGLPGQWRLVARNAFNGVLLWKRDMSEWGSAAWSYWTESHAARFNHPLHVRKRLIAQGNRVYATLGFNSPVTAIDAASGETVMTYEGTEFADEVVLHDGVLYVAVNNEAQQPWPGEGVRPEPSSRRPPSEKHVWAINADSGSVLWKAGPFLGNAAKLDRMASMRHLNLVAAETGVFLIDEKHVVGLDRRTGAEMWRIDRLFSEQPLEKATSVGDLYHMLAGENIHTVIHHEGRLMVLHLTSHSSMKHKSPAILQAIDPTTGRELWRYDQAAPISYIEWPDVFAVRDTVWLPDRNSMTLVGVDTTTGKEKARHDIEKALDVSHHHRCYPNRASVNFAVLGRRGAEFVDLETGELTLHHWLRTGCRAGHVLGNGLLYRPPDHCQCYMEFQPRGFMAMSATETTVERPTVSLRLTQGPAFGLVDATSESTGDWPTYRHDAMRSGMATSPIPASLASSWQVDLSTTASSPIVAAGRVFVALKDTHQILAIDAATGEQDWTFTTDGRIDSPPTAYQGYLLFGCHDGSVYCLRSSDGQPVWRFQAAPDERRIVAFGQVESRWPVCGSILVTGGTAYFVAGRTSLLDQGIMAYSLDVATGKVLDTERIYEIQTETKTTGELPEGALSDILTTDGQSVYLRKRKLELSPPVQGVTPERLAATRPTLRAEGGFANSRWFHRAFWHFSSTVARGKGNLIAFDGTRTYVAAANLPGSPNQTFHIPAGGLTNRVAGVDGDGPSWLANPNLQVGGTVLFAAESKTDEVSAELPDPRDVRYGKATSPPDAAIWRHNHFPIYPWAMVVGSTYLAVAGPSAEVTRDDPWAGLEGRAGGELYILDTKSGESRCKIDLASPPVWDGMAVAGGRLIISTQDGRLVCFE